jgi:allophanate hydrolase subunit 2
MLGGSAVGARAYLAVKGGWQTAPVLGSRSREERVRPGDVLDAAPGTTPVRRPGEPAWEAPNLWPIRVIDGPDAPRSARHEAWLNAPFRVGPQASRMGLRLDGPAPAVEAFPERISAPVAPGAVQVAGAQAIILGVACGTMGGYPHVAHVITADLDRVGQLRPGDAFRFRRVSLDEARRIDRLERQARSDRLRRLATLSRDTLDPGRAGNR